MRYEDDIGKFVTVSYEKVDGKKIIAMGELIDIDENGLLVIQNLKFPDKSKRVHPKTILNYSAEPLEVEK